MGALLAIDSLKSYPVNGSFRFIDYLSKLKRDYIIKKLSNTKYRVLLGPFNDIKKLEESFNEIKLLNFENLQILKNV